MRMVMSTVDLIQPTENRPDRKGCPPPLTQMSNAPRKTEKSRICEIQIHRHKDKNTQNTFVK